MRGAGMGGMAMAPGRDPAWPPGGGARVVRRWLLGALAMLGGGAAGPMEPRSIAYGPGPDQELDFFRPAGAAPVPLAVYVHGGGWDRGSRRSVRPALRALLGQGFAVASLDYPLGPAAPLEEQAGAVARGIAWLAGHAGELGIDPARIVVLGSSAGANVASLAVLRHDLSPGGAPPPVRLVVGLDGVGFDVAGLMAARPNHPRLVPVFGRDPARWARLSPAALVEAAPRGSVPPFLLVNGDAIFAVDAERFAAVLRASGVPVERHVIPGLGHAEFVRSLTEPGSALSGILKRALGAI